MKLRFVEREATEVIKDYGDGSKLMSRKIVKILQFRTAKYEAYANRLSWSEWQDVPVSKEGE